MDKHLIRVATCAALAVAFSSGVRRAFAQVGPDGIDWVTIGTPNNPAYDGEDPFNRVRGRGSVGYEYKIGRTETTTALWVEFYNTFKARADPVSDLVLPPFLIRGSERDPDYHGPGTRLRVRTDLPNAAMIPVGGFDWRTAARLVNWLCNDKSSAHSAIVNGAYDTSTFGGAGTWTDQVAHNPGARYWIPTLDEWIKAVHYDPNGNGPGQGRWWSQPNGSDTPLLYGPPPGYPGGSPLNQANAGFSFPNFAHELIPLGSYPTVVSPWGLLDAAGGTNEWLESVLTIGNQRFRSQDGSYNGSSTSSAQYLDSLVGFTGNAPSQFFSTSGFRIASAVPAPSSSIVLGLSLVGLGRRKARPGQQENHNAQALDNGCPRGRVVVRFRGVGSVRSLARQ